MATRLNPTVVAVTPVLGALFEPLTVGAQEALSLELENLSATETFTASMRREAEDDGPRPPPTITRRSHDGCTPWWRTCGYPVPMRLHCYLTYVF